MLDLIYTDPSQPPVAEKYHYSVRNSQEITLPPHSVTAIKLDAALQGELDNQVPVLMVHRSLASKGIFMLGEFHIFDIMPEEVLEIKLYNATKAPFLLDKGSRVADLLFLPCQQDACVIKRAKRI